MSLIELTIESRQRDIGGFSVGRILPFARRRMVGPFVFLDHMGPAHFEAGDGLDVKPHPHIGLATVTYLFEGEIQHRDTLGSNQFIKPGDVNWMTAGQGISHSERTGVDERSRKHNTHGLQSWVALPKEFEETKPEFFHHGKTSLPEFEMKGVKLRLIAGSAYGYDAPVKIYSPLFYVEAHMQPGSNLQLPNEYKERAVYLIIGSIRLNGTEVKPLSMPVLLPGNANIEALAPSHLVILGGDPVGERYIWWNFVSSSKERIEQAKQDWQEGRFGLIPGDDKEFVPLPEEKTN